MQKNHFWQGKWIDNNELKSRIANIDKYTNDTLGKNFPLEYFLDISQKFHDSLQKKDIFYQELLNLIITTNSISKSKAQSMLDMLISFLNKKNLQTKLKSELGSQNPFELKKKSYKQDFFEAWAPMGVMVHIAPTNVFTVGVLCVIEGLLAGNINILKTSSSQHMLPQIFFEAFLKLDDKNLLKPYIIIAEVSSRQSDLLSLIIQNTDVVSAWGSEEAIKSVRAMTPQGTRFVEWGHKISFAYFCKDELDNEDAMKEVCKDICLLDQNACSSPQNVFIQSDDFAKLKLFSKTFSKILNEVSKQSKIADIDNATQAEISTIINVAKTEEALGLTHVVQADDFSWCVIADKRKGLSISPLFRTILIKPLPKNKIISKLRPMKNYLQTVALVAKNKKVYEFTKLLLGAGCLRIKSAGHMHDNYLGEPHDGVYALPNFMKRISLVLPNQLENISTFEHFNKPYEQDLKEYKIMDKKQFQSMIVEDKYIDLTFKSGGSSGKTTYSYYSYDDYHRVLQESAKGLYSAGLNPKTDKVLNMFAAGQLYGGFISFWTILEYLETSQYPMGIVDDLKEVGKFIVEKKINTLLTAPSLVMNIFEQNRELFKKHPMIKKVFFGGDHFSKNQILYLKNEFRVEFVKAAAYGSNDAGPLGYQCQHCKANEYHLLQEILTLEVFDTIEDKLVNDGDTGRLIFTSKQREGQNIIRYDLGDLGFKHTSTCRCKREDTKFTLLGRSGDAFKAGGPFLHFNTFMKLLEEGFDYKGLVQIVLDEFKEKQKLLLKIEDSIKDSEKDIKDYILKNSDETKMSVEELGMIFEIKIVSKKDFEVVTHSGKVKHIVDKRILS